MDHDNNRSSAPTPEQLAMMNSAASAAMRETIATMMKELIAPLMREVALTPEKIAALKAPYVDEAAKAREKRESQQTREQEAENLRVIRAMRDNCPHKYPNNTLAIGLMRNFPDRIPRGICMLCQDIIEPRHWVISAPDPITGKTTAHIVSAHKDYVMVQQAESFRA